MSVTRRSFHLGHVPHVIATVSLIVVLGCSGDEPAANTDEPSTPADVAVAQDEPDSQDDAPAEHAPHFASSHLDEPPIDEAVPTTPAVTYEEADFEAAPPTTEIVATAGPANEPTIEPVTETVAETGTESPSLDEMLADLEIPPPWLENVETSYATSHPWKEARLEIRRLLGLGQPETHREAMKLTWLYLQKDDIGDGHEYPMYMFLGGEPLWAVKAFEWYINKHDSKAPIYGLMGLAPLYARYGEYEKAKALLDEAMDNLPEPPWQIMRKADVFDAYGDLYAAWGKPDEAKRYYAQAIELYPKAKPPYGGHLLPRRATKVQSKLDLLTFRSLGTAELRDGRYQDRALGYAGDIHVTLVVQDGKIADISLRHEEKIDQNACTLIPQRIIDSQSLQVDGVSGATVTKDAIVSGAYRCLKKAGLK